jgi:hypothetical protein
MLVESIGFPECDNQSITQRYQSKYTLDYRARADLVKDRAFFTIYFRLSKKLGYLVKDFGEQYTGKSFTASKTYVIKQQCHFCSRTIPS